MRFSSGQWVICIVFGFAGLVFAGFIGSTLVTSGCSQRTKLTKELTKEQKEFLRQEQAMATGDQSFSMEREDMGINDPKAYAVDEVTIKDNSEVMGIEVNGKYRAYRLIGMSDSTSRHIVHDQLGGKPITMTFCDRNGCSRAFVRKNVSKDDFMMGGWSGKEMWLLINNKRYRHSSKKIPMEDYPIEVTTWGEWKKAHPDTDIYLGP